MAHPTQIFLSNPQALRVEYRLDEARLILWWSPKAGASTDCRDRNFSNWMDHLEVFEEIVLPGCGLGQFSGCDYDPYHCALRFSDRTLHLAVRHDTAAVLVWSDAPQAVVVKTNRYDRRTVAEPGLFAVRHAAPSYRFEFAAAAGPGGGNLRHCPVHGEWNSHYTRVELEAGQLLCIGCGLEGDGIAARLAALAAQGPEQHLAAVAAALVPVEAAARVEAPHHPELETLQRQVKRGLHSMLDESATLRASLKAVYYQVWIRDSSFTLAYQAAAGWPHKLRELCRLLLDNPLTVEGGAGAPGGRMFGQMINRTYGKCEEDGLFYVVWALFTHWTQQGDLDFMTAADWDLLGEALEWIEQAAWDPQRGLYGGHWADETPTLGWRDFGWDHAFGKPLDGRDVVRHEGQRVTRSYDTYLNLLMHSTLTMLAALHPERFGSLGGRAADLWRELEPLMARRTDGLPPYGELVLESGERVLCAHWGPATSVYIWGLALPCFAPLDDWDAVRARLLAEIMQAPRMHWINGICAAAAAVDPWFGGEEAVLAALQAVAAETERPGTFLPMGGAMPEKMGAPEGSFHNDIRPQAFAMGAWLGALASLAVRRLPHGLALRPARTIASLSDYAWRGRVLDFVFGASGPDLALEINGKPVRHTLQIPEECLPQGRNRIRLVEAPAGPLLLRSTVGLESVSPADGAVAYNLRAFGLSEILFARPVSIISLQTAAGEPVPNALEDYRDGAMLRFTATGPLVLHAAASASP